MSDARTSAPNPGKSLRIETSRGAFNRIPLRTHVITDADRMTDVVERYAASLLRPGDLLFVSEKIVAISQGRAYKLEDIQPSRLARFLVRFVHKTPHGIGLGSPWTMELALRDVGLPRIVFAGLCSLVTKPLGIRGVFYRVVGHDVNAIDGPCAYTLPPYNGYAKLGPKDPDGVARELSVVLRIPVVIVDANDLGVNVLGRSDDESNEDWYRELFRDNPLGQSSEQTPMAIVRKSEA